MTNTMNYNNKNFQDATVAVMNDIFASDANGSSMDDLYKAACKYAKMSRKEFDEKYAMAQEKVAEWKMAGALDGANCELNDDDLDMVVGGSIGSFFSAIGEGLATAACAVGNFVKEHAVEIGIVVGITALAFAGGAGVGAFVAWLVAGTEFAVSATGVAVTMGCTMGAMGLAGSINCVVNGEN